MSDDPIDRIKWMPADDVRANDWNPNHVARSELTLLETSLMLTGWIQPVLVYPVEEVEHSHAIIDGFHRWRLTLESPHLRATYGGKMPVAVLDLDHISAMLLTVRINRAKGTHGSVAMSVLVRRLIEAGATREQIKVEMGATDQELDLLATPDVFKARKVEGWRYSPSWAPFEDGLKPRRT